MRNQKSANMSKKNNNNQTKQKKKHVTIQKS